MVYPTTASACICKTPENPLKESTAAFSGTVLAVKDWKQLRNRYEVTIEVNQVWKGTLDNEVTVWTDDYSMYCGQRFTIGSSYIIYGRYTGQEGAYQTNNCTTLEMPQALLHLIILNSKTWGALLLMAISVAYYVKMTWKK